MATVVQINTMLTAEHIADGYIERLVADLLGANAIIDVAYGPPDEHGLICVVGEARQSAAAS